MSVPVERLAEHPFLAGLDASDLARLAALAEEKLFEPGSYLCRYGEPADWLHLVRRGTVALELHDPARGPVVIGTAKDGEVVGISALVSDRPYRLDARVVEATRTISLAAAPLRQLCEQEPRLGWKLAQRLLDVAFERLTSARFQAADLYAPPGGPR